MCAILDGIKLLSHRYWIQLKTASMFFSLLHVPRYRIHSLANCWDETFHSLCKTGENNSRIRLLGSRIYGLEGGHSKKWTRRPITTKTEGSKQTTHNTRIYGLEEGHSKKWTRRPITNNAEGSKQTTHSTKSRSMKHEILSETIAASAAVNVNKPQLCQFQEIQYHDIQQLIAQDKDLSSLVTVIVFDIETTGFSREYERIIEIALRDLQGGENSTFQTLVNPQRKVPNSEIHGITTQMVNRPDVPRMEDLIPILLQYVRSRQKPGGYVLWVAHNARNFDVPFIINEFSRCSTEVPSNWLFVDTLPLARELMKSGGTKLSSTSLAALRELYRIQVNGSAHRAMVDVNTLSMILPRLTFDLKLTISGLVKKCFTESDLIKSKRKKNTS